VKNNKKDGAQFMKSKKKKIIVTLGPASSNKDSIKKMDKAGVDIFRINMSHSTIEELKNMAGLVKECTTKAFCPDTEGAQLRTGILNRDGKLKLEPYDYVEFVYGQSTLGTHQIPLNISPSKILKKGDLLKIDFDTVLIQISEKNDCVVRGRVLQGGVIGTNKGIGVDRQILLPAFSEKDIEAFKLSNDLGLKHIALSFASSREDIKKLRTFFNYDIEVISKIESRTALQNLDGICEESDAILIDRGDLSRDVPLEKIVFAQQYIIEKAKKLGTDVYVATNLMENMIWNSKPTRAEVHDIVSTLNSGIDGLVLAAETAIGKYPVECVRIMSRIIREVDSESNYDIEYLTTPPADRIIEPHGGVLIHQVLRKNETTALDNFPRLEVDDNIISDVFQIANGVYSPITGFMGVEELNSVLDHYKLLSGDIWSLPILLQFSEEEKKSLPAEGKITLISKTDGKAYAIMELSAVEKIDNLEHTLSRLFGTNDKGHPGVKMFCDRGDYIGVGKTILISDDQNFGSFEGVMTPKQTREIINDAGWHDIVGFHTRNVAHAAHEYIKKEALASVQADALFISPVVGKKKKGDFKGEAIMKCYEMMVKKGYYNPYGVIISAFATYSRYCGPREAIFTALCRKNFGCNHFIIGRDHTGVGSFYGADDSVTIFNDLDIGINIISFDKAAFCVECGEMTIGCIHGEEEKKQISGDKIRESLVSGTKIPWYMMRKDISTYLQGRYKKDKEEVLEN
jgi:pyruvate kinase